MNKKLFLVLIGITSISLATRADIIPTLSSVTGSSPNFTWNYSANVTVNENINTGDFFTIYDFGSIAPGSNTQPTGWTFSQSLIGPTAALTSPTDNPNILNLTWTYTGTTPITGSAALGIFSVMTGTDQLKTGQFTASATRNSGPDAGTKISNIGSVAVPVPEPSAVFPILSLCAAIGVDRFFRHRRTA
ncbi:MAG TPA: hypothetical protein VN827_05260 [Chthoniobacterales bacterium]|jgi:hypothetical protein|nr:hypothetical protein [Chthoniobacterales bacterium]